MTVGIMQSTIPILCNGVRHTEFQAFWLGDGRWCVHDMITGQSEVRDLGHSGTWMIPSRSSIELNFTSDSREPTMPGKII